MTSNKNTAIKEIIKEFELFSNLILKQLDLLDKLFETENLQPSDKIIEQLNENEEEIDKYEIDLEAQIIRAIVLYKPVASDLRQIFALYRIVINLERIGDLVIKIAKYIIKINNIDFLEK